MTKDCYHRENIFQTWASCKGQMCSLVIDTQSCTNAISEEAVNNWD